MNELVSTPLPKEIYNLNKLPDNPSTSLEANKKNRNRMIGWPGKSKKSDILSARSKWNEAYENFENFDDKHEVISTKRKVTFTIQPISSTYIYKGLKNERIKSDITEVSIGLGVTKIHEKAFQNKLLLHSISGVFPKSLKNIGYHSFKGCKNLKVIPPFNEELALIGNGAFSGCEKLNFEVMELPFNLEVVDKERFFKRIGL